MADRVPGVITRRRTSTVSSRRPMTTKTWSYDPCRDSEGFTHRSGLGRTQYGKIARPVINDTALDVYIHSPASHESYNDLIACTYVVLPKQFHRSRDQFESSRSA